MMQKCASGKNNDLGTDKNKINEKNEKKTRNLLNSMPGLKEGLALTCITFLLQSCQINGEKSVHNKSHKPLATQSTTSESKPQSQLILHDGTLKEFALLMKEGSSASFRPNEKIPITIFLKVIRVGEEGVDIVLGTETPTAKSAHQMFRIGYGEAELGDGPIEKLAVKKENDEKITIKIFLNADFKLQ